MVWEECLARLRAELAPEQFSTWISPLEARQGGSTIRLVAPNEYVGQTVQEQYIGRIEELVGLCGDPASPMSVELWEQTLVRCRPATPTGVTDDPARSHSLPAWAHLDPDVYEREKHELFYKSWTYAGWVGDLRTPGGYITAELLDQSVIIMRGRGGTLQQRYDEYFPIRANWKIVMDNFLECYHCPPAHPGSLRDLTFEDLTYTGHDLWAKQMSGTRRADGDQQMFWTLFPSFVFWNSGTREKQSIHAMNFGAPEGPARTGAGRMDVYRLPEELDTEEWRPDWGDIGGEDKSLCESVQKGLASLGYDRGRVIYNPDGNSEGAMHAFQRFVVRTLGI